MLAIAILAAQPACQEEKKDKEEIIPVQVVSIDKSQELPGEPPGVEGLRVIRVAHEDLLDRAFRLLQVAVRISASG